MAQIPYGYRIERGKAVIISEEAERIKQFLSLYLGGCSIKAAGVEAGIHYSCYALIRLLRNRLYLGTDYYSAIIGRATFEAVNEAYKKRTHTGQSKPSPITPVEKLFRFIAPSDEQAGKMSAVDAAAYLYGLIRPNESGHATMTKEEVSAVNAWRERTGN